MDKFQNAQFIFAVLVDADDEEERRVPSVYDFVASVFDEGALELGSRQTGADDLGFQRDALGHGQPLVVGGEARLALLVDHEDELDGHVCGGAALALCD